MWSARLLRMTLVAATTVIVAAVASYWWLAPRQTASSETRGSILSVAALQDVGGPLRLTDNRGQPFDSRDLEADAMVVYFGFSYCPDVCPVDLGRMTTAVAALAPELQARVQPVFVTVDPERDTPEQMASYVQLYSDRLVGLTGSAEEIAEAASAFKVYYEKAETEGSSDYVMNHTNYIYLTRPTGETLAIFPPGQPPESMAETIAAEIEG